MALHVHGEVAAHKNTRCLQERAETPSWGTVSGEVQVDAHKREQRHHHGEL